MRKILASAIIATSILGFATAAEAHSWRVSADCSGLTVRANADYEGPASSDPNTANNVLTIVVDGGAPRLYGFGAAGLTVNIPWDPDVNHAYVATIDANRFSGDASAYDTRAEGSVTNCVPATTVEETTTTVEATTTTVAETTTTIPEATTTVAETTTTAVPLLTMPLPIYPTTTAAVAVAAPPAPTTPPAGLPETGMKANIAILAGVFLLSGITLILARRRAT